MICKYHPSAAHGHHRLTRNPTMKRTTTATELPGGIWLGLECGHVRYHPASLASPTPDHCVGRTCRAAGPGRLLRRRSSLACHRNTDTPRRDRAQTTPSHRPGFRCGVLRSVLRPPCTIRIPTSRTCIMIGLGAHRRFSIVGT